MKMTKFFALLASVALFAACTESSKDEEKPQPTPTPEPSGAITLSADKTTIELGESVTFTVTMKNAETGETTDITTEASLYDSNLDKVSNPFTPTASGSYNINAVYGPESSNVLTITVMAQMPEVPEDTEPSNLAFNHRILLIDHTGVNCGYCPNMTDNLLALEESDMHHMYNEVTCHAGGMASGDPGNSNAANALNKFQSNYIEGYPNICVNFHTTTVGNYATATFLNQMRNVFNQHVKKDGASVGISLAVAGDHTNVYCAAQIKAKDSKEYKAVAWLLESGIYSPNQAGAKKDVHRIYNYALRNISGTYSQSNVAGESIGWLEEGQTIDQAFKLPITSTKWNHENMGVLVIVSAKDSQGRWEVVNTAYCPTGESKGYEYIK